MKIRWRLYRTASGARPFQEFFEGLSFETRIRLKELMHEISKEGLRRARHLQGDIYEVRLRTDEGAFRVLFSMEGRRRHVFLALSGFTKKAQKTPHAEIALALKRLNDWRCRSR